MSKKIVLAADGKTATVSDAVIGDIFSTIVSQDSAVTGIYGLAQRAGLVVAGMAVNSFRLRGTPNPFVK